MPTLKEKTLLVKLFYQIQNKLVVAGKKFRHMKRIRRGPMSSYALLKIIQKFERTGQLVFLLGREQKHTPSSSIENEATAVVEANSQSPDVSVPAVSRVLDMPYFTVENSCSGFCIFIPTKSDCASIEVWGFKGS
ncbi:DUF4817 domain-containing protein [Trichonephila clavipes]|nr:DUF4817 domain-containing protein [Trichonephila clavipes]